jgi:hypothetical protein
MMRIIFQFNQAKRQACQGKNVRKKSVKRVGLVA